MRIRRQAFMRRSIEPAELGCGFEMARSAQCLVILLGSRRSASSRIVRAPCSTGLPRPSARGRRSVPLHRRWWPALWWASGGPARRRCRRRRVRCRDAARRRLRGCLPKADLRRKARLRRRPKADPRRADRRPGHLRPRLVRRFRKSRIRCGASFHGRLQYEPRTPKRPARTAAGLPAAGRARSS